MSDIALESSHGHFPPLPPLSFLPSPSFLFSWPDDRQWQHLRAISPAINSAAEWLGGRVYDSLKPCCMTHNIAIGKTSSALLSLSLFLSLHSLFPLSKPSISRRRRRIACNYFYDFIQRQLTLQFVSGSVRRRRRKGRGGGERGLPFDAPYPSFDDDDFYGSRVTQLVILLSNCYETTDGPSFLPSLASFTRG